MDVSSVKTQPVQTQAAVKRAQNQPSTQNQTTKNHEAGVSKVAEHKPVVNSQGQTTGRLLNVTA